MLKRLKGCFAICLVIIIGGGAASAQTWRDRATAYLNDYLQPRIANCGDSYFVLYGKTGLYETKRRPTFVISQERVLPAEVLSEADRLNGKTRGLPERWYAQLQFGIQTPPWRSFKNVGWSPWRNDRHLDGIHTVRFTDDLVWKVQYSYGDGLQIIGNYKCSGSDIEFEGIPNLPSRVVTSQPPSWRELSQTESEWNKRATYELTIPASFGEWFSLGRGPLMVRMRNSFSTISIDGTDNTRNPMGQAHFYGANKYSVDAVAPNLMLGAVILKIGVNGEAIQPFSAETMSVLDGFKTDTNEEVFIAINDSNFRDNRGEHVVMVGGPNICLGCPAELPESSLPTLKKREPDQLEGRPGIPAPASEADPILAKLIQDTLRNSGMKEAVVYASKLATGKYFISVGNVVNKESELKEVTKQINKYVFDIAVKRDIIWEVCVKHHTDFDKTKPEVCPGRAAYRRVKIDGVIQLIKVQ